MDLEWTNWFVVTFKVDKKYKVQYQYWFQYKFKLCGWPEGRTTMLARIKLQSNRRKISIREDGSNIQKIVSLFLIEFTKKWFKEY